MTNQMLLVTSLVLTACASSPAVTVADTAPQGCDLLGEVNASGAYWERGAGEKAVQRLKDETRALGGDGLVCCSLSDTLVLYRFEGNQYSGRAFRCRSEMQDESRLETEGALGNGTGW